MNSTASRSLLDDSRPTRLPVNFFDEDSVVTVVDVRPPQLDWAPQFSSNVGSLPPLRSRAATTVPRRKLSRKIAMVLAQVFFVVAMGLAGSFAVNLLPRPLTLELVFPIVVATAFATWFLLGLFGRYTIAGPLAAGLCGIAFAGTALGAQEVASLVAGALTIAVGLSLLAMRAR